MDAELPFLDLFYQLRDAGLDLGIPEYHVLLRAFSQGFGVKDEDDLKQVCLALWVKNPQQKLLFNHHFKQYMEARRKRQEAQQATQPSLTPTQLASPKSEEFGEGREGAERARYEATAGEGRSSETATEEVTQPPSGPAGEGIGMRAPSTLPLSSEGLGAQEAPTTAARPYLPVLADEVDLARILQAALEAPHVIEQRYITTGEYYPVTQRQMKQNWRYLRRMVKEGPRTELNVDATIRQVASQGMLFDLVLEPRRSNRSELILLVDRDGSMVPFHTLAQRLVETAHKGGRLERTGVYYFHDCPNDYLYTDLYLVQAKSLQHVLSYLHSDQAVLLIFSDAGAARGGLDPARIEQTRQFLQIMRRGVRRLAWLNPVPQKNWANTTAAEISRLVPMFELSRRGMDAAIDVLRGRLVVLTRMR